MQLIRSLLWVTLLFCSLANAQVNLGLFVSEQAVTPDNPPPEISITASNNQGAQVRDVHIGVIGPDNRIYEFPDWNTELRPWLPGFPIANGLQLDALKITALEDFPGGLTPGVWQAFFALTEPGTIEITDLKLVSFSALGDAVGGQQRFGGITLVRSSDPNSGTAVNAGAVFFQSDAQGFIDTTLSDSQSVSLDQCRFEQQTINTDIDVPDITPPQTLDAGFLTIIASNGSRVDMVRQEAGGFLGYGAQPGPGFFNNQSFTFEGDGGPGVGPFQVTVSGVPAINLSQPVANFVVDGNQDFIIAWENNVNGSGEVFVSMAATQLDLSNPLAITGATISCRFVDDGNALIPRNLVRQLADFAQGGGLPGIPAIPGLPGLGDINFSMARTSFAFFTSQDPKLDTGLASVSSSVILTGTAQ